MFGDCRLAAVRCRGRPLEQGVVAGDRDVAFSSTISIHERDRVDMKVPPATDIYQRTRCDEKLRSTWAHSFQPESLDLSGRKTPTVMPFALPQALLVSFEIHI